MDLNVQESDGLEGIGLEFLGNRNRYLEVGCFSRLVKVDGWCGVK